MNNNINDTYKRLVTYRDIKTKSLIKKQSRLKKLQKELRNLNESKEILLLAAKESQLTVKNELEAMVNLCISAVYTRPFAFKLAIENKTRPIITENGYELNPKDDAAGGLIDIISFAVPIALWFLDDENQTRPFFIYDEPFKNTGDLIDRAGKAMKTLAKHLDLKILLVSHEDELTELADNAYQITHNGQFSVLTQIKRKITRR